jgi:hypothetical protein
VFRVDNEVDLWYNDDMTLSSKTNSKSILARALATENIRVEHSPSVHTAMFDVANRVLILPVWKDMSDELYDMFVGHEVGHALFTPHKDEKVNGPWCYDAERIGGNVHASYVQGIMNVVEDARIERKMKDKYPGLRRDFSVGYRDLMDRDFFGIKEKNINDMSFVDRLNIHFKCGFAMNVNFTEDEQKIVDAVTTSESFDEVIELTERIFKHINGSRQDEKNSEPTGSVPVEMMRGNGEGGMSNVSVTVSSNSNEGTSQDSNQGSPSNQSNGLEDKNTSNAQSSNLRGGKGLAPDILLPPINTQMNMEEKIRNEMVNKNASGVNYYTLGVPDISRIVLPWQKASVIMSSHFDNNFNTNVSKKIQANINRMFNELNQNIKPMINTLVKQFEMKKAADISKRTSVSRTGKINPDRIFKYKVSDDIFLRCAKIAEGKNHGLIMYIDWSSSMQIVTNDVINQVIILTQFCRRMNIPFEVYLFTSQYPVLANHLGISKENNAFYDVDFKQWKKNNLQHSNTRHSVGSDDHEGENEHFALINVLSSEMSARQFNEGLRNVYTLGMMINPVNDIYEGIDPSQYRYARRNAPEYFSQGNTPLDSTVIASMYMIPEFQRKHKIQIVNAIFLTDGETGWSLFHTSDQEWSENMYGSRSYVRCPINNREYKCIQASSTDLLLEILGDVTGCTTIGFFINSSSGKYCRYYRNDSSERVSDFESFKENGFFDAPKTKTYKSHYGNETPIVAKNHGYDRLFVLPSKMSISEGMEDLDTLNSNATLTKIRNTFTKSVEKRNSSRLFLNRFADVIAVGNTR